MTSICDSKENFKRLLDALKDIDNKLEKENKSKEEIKEQEKKTNSNKENLNIKLQLPKKE